MRAIPFTKATICPERGQSGQFNLKRGRDQASLDGEFLGLNVAIPILIRAAVAFVVAVGGGVLSALLARTHKQLCAMISLGAGTLLGVTIFAIVPECWTGLTPVQFVIIAGASGYQLFSRSSANTCFTSAPACAASHFDEAATHHGSAKSRRP